MKKIKLISLVLLGCFFLVAIISCSAGKYFLGWHDRPGSGEPKMVAFLSGIRPQPGNPDSHYLLASYYQQRGQHREAIEEFKKTLMIDPSYVKAYNGMGVSFDLTGDFSRAAESYQAALRLDPNLDYVLNNLGYSLLLQGNIDGAIEAFQRAVALNDAEMRFHNNLGLAYAEKGQFDLALAQFKKGGDEAKAHYNIAQIYLRKELFQEAKEHYAKALALNPSLTVVQTGLDAANALARIFKPENKRPVPRAVVLPEQPTIMEEKIIQVASSPLPPKKEPEIKHTIDDIPPQGRIEAGIRVEAAIVKIEELKQPEILKPFEQETARSNLPESNGNGARVADILSLKKASIEVSNGNGVNRMARRVSDYLGQKGLRVVRLTNASHFNHSRTIIYYQNEQKGLVDLLADHFPVNFGKKEIAKLDRPDIKIKVLIGKDLVPKNHFFESDNGNRAPKKN